MKREALNQINKFVDFHPSPRIKINICLEGNEKEDSDNLIFGKKIVLDHNGKHQEIDYSDVSEIRLSMCSRIYNQGVIEYNPAKWFVKIWQTGAVGTVMVHIQYYLDFDIVLKDKGVVVNDPYQIENILTKYPDAMKLVNFLNEAFPKMAKKYGLDNPRGVEAIK